MRQIKFRAWDRKHKKIVTLDEYKICIRDKGAYWIDQNDKVFRNDRVKNDIVLMQLTELKDQI